MKANYAVVVTYSFDPEVFVKLFENLDDAKNYLETDWRRELTIDTEENGWDSDFYISEDRDYAKITNHFADRDDETIWQIGIVYDEER